MRWKIRLGQVQAVGLWSPCRRLVYHDTNLKPSALAWPDGPVFWDIDHPVRLVLQINVAVGKNGQFACGVPRWRRLKSENEVGLKQGALTCR